MASTHDELNALLVTGFDTKIAKQVGELSSVATAYKQWETAQANISTSEQLEQSSRNLSVALTPRHPFADMPCLIEIRPGPGGLEGRFFADTLCQMYQRYCANMGMRCRVVTHEAGDALGDTGADGEIALQEAMLEVSDPGAYDLFRGEAGMHRVQRVPVTEKSGRTHTSAVAVWVLPSFPENGSALEVADFEDPESDFYVDVSEVRTETMRARGAGGQHVNKTESAIRLTHYPTGTVVSMQDARSQSQNRERAWRLLRSRIAQKRREAREETARALKNSVLSRSQLTRGDKIRTYNYQQNRCTDHRCGLDVFNLPDVLAGGPSLAKIFGVVRNWLTDKDIQALVEEEAAVVEEKPKGR